jgi:hypothetical protein
MTTISAGDFVLSMVKYAVPVYDDNGDFDGINATFTDNSVIFIPVDKNSWDKRTIHSGCQQEG